MIPTQRHSDQLTSQVAALRGLARVLVRGASEAEDLLQDTLVVALQSAPTETEGLAAWLRGVMRHKAQHSRRSQAARVRRERQGARNEALPATVDLVTRKAQLATLVDEVLQLKEPYQTVLYLRYFEDKGPREIALELDIPEGTVASQVHRGLELLRSRLDHRADGDRSAWVGALLPWFSGEAATLGSSWGGVWMAGTLKLVGAAAVVAAVLYVAWNRDVMPGERLALVPEMGAVSEGSGPREEVVVPLEQERATEPAEVAEAVAKPAAPVPIVDTAPLVSEVFAVAEPDTPLTPAELAPPGRDDFGAETLMVDRRHVFHIWMGGFDISIGGEPAYGPEFTWEFEQTVLASDSITWLPGDTWPTVLRTVNPSASLEATGDSLQVQHETDALQKASSALDGRAIRFSYDDREQAYSAQLQDEKNPEQWNAVEGLEEDMDLRALRPPVGVAAGQTWEIPCAWTRGLFRPGGDLKLNFEDQQVSSLTGGLSAGAFDFGLMGLIPEGIDANESTGTCTLTAEGLITKDGCEFRPLRISMSLERTMDGLTFVGESAGSDSEIPAPLESALKLAKVDVRLALEGTATWDPVGQRVTMLMLEGILESEMHLEIEGAPAADISMDLSLQIDVKNEVPDSAR